MRRAVLFTLSLGETLVAGVLLFLGWSLPTTAEVQAGFSQAERVTTQARTQVTMLRQQVHTVRQIELRVLAERLKDQTHALTQTLRTQPLDFGMVSTVRDAIGELAGGLSNLAEGLDPRAAARLGTGLEETATFLEEMFSPRVGPPPERTEREQEAETVLKDLATTLRQAVRSIDTTVVRWPEIQKTLSRLALLLRTARDQLNLAIQRRADYEETMYQTTQLADKLVAVLPLLIEQLTGQLDQQDRALEEMGCSLDEFEALIPVYSRSAAQLIQTGRLLTWLVAIFVLVHTVYLVSQLFEGASHSVPGASPMR